MNNRRQIVKVLLILILSYFSWVMGRSLWQLYQARDRLSEGDGALAEVKIERQELEQRWEVVNSDEFREKEVRDKLNRQLLGETVVVVSEIELGDRSGEDNDEGNARQNWQKWWDLFFLES